MLAVVEHGAARCSTVAASALCGDCDRIGDVKTSDYGRICIVCRQLGQTRGRGFRNVSESFSFFPAAYVPSCVCSNKATDLVFF